MSDGSRGCATYSFMPISEGRHTLVRLLRNCRLLLQILLESLTPDNDGNAAPVSEKPPCRSLSHLMPFVFVAVSTN